MVFCSPTTHPNMWLDYTFDQWPLYVLGENIDLVHQSKVGI